MGRIQAENDIFEIQGEVVQLRFHKEEALVEADRAREALNLARVGAADQEKSLYKTNLQLAASSNRIEELMKEFERKTDELKRT
ncbi:hypothetical protein ACFXTH_028326 [Malus domestica]